MDERFWVPDGSHACRACWRCYGRADGQHGGKGSGPGCFIDCPRDRAGFHLERNPVGHGLVRDADRQKMSKTKGNVIDPLVVTEKYGTDAVRMALLQGAAPGTDIVLTEERMESSRAFANKIWNAARFLFMNADQASGLSGLSSAEPAAPTIEDRWILARIRAAAETANRAIEQYRYHEFAQELWKF